MKRGRRRNVRGGEKKERGRRLLLPLVFSLSSSLRKKGWEKGTGKRQGREEGRERGEIDKPLSFILSSLSKKEERGG